MKNHRLKIAAIFSLALTTGTLLLHAQTNDSFADSIQLDFVTAPNGAGVITDATLEPGEPAHKDGAPCKSLWWHWQTHANGTMTVILDGGSATNVMFALYTGNAIDSLSLVRRQIGSFNAFTVGGGIVFHLAVVADEETAGDVHFHILSSEGGPAPPVVAQANLLCEPSFEGTGLHFTCWHSTGLAGGYVNERGGADGTTWPVYDNGGALWQDFPTIPGHLYNVKFAFRPDMGATTGAASVMWDDRTVGSVSADDGVYWHWGNFDVYGSNTISRLTISMEGRLGLDAFSVIDESAPPQIVQQPAAVDALAGGSASLFTIATGSEPLRYQWLFNDQPLAGKTNYLIALNLASTNDVGDYQVVITNASGSITSSIAHVSVTVISDATILYQPYGDTLPAGGYYKLSVFAGGDTPLRYQWEKDGSPVMGATNRDITFTSILTSDAGTYRVQVQNDHSSVLSLPAVLVVSTNDPGGGWINFRNKFTVPPSNSVPIYAADGFTPINSANYVAQLYSGPTLERLRPAGSPSAFLGAGLFTGELVQLPNVPVGGTGVLQVRVWDSTQSASYEEARATGKEFGKSEIMTQTAGSQGFFAPNMLGLQSFSLQSGLSLFTVGIVKFVDVQPPGQITWELQGAAGFRYLIEKSDQNFSWLPFAVVTNLFGTVNFTDSTLGSQNTVFYRARILD